MAVLEKDRTPETKRIPERVGIFRQLLGTIPPGMERNLTFVGLTIVLIFLIFAIFSPIIAPYDPNIVSTEQIADRFTPPFQTSDRGYQYILGTDDIGQDVLSRVIYGARIALLVAFVASLFSVLIGVPLGLLAGYRGGNFDRVLTMIMDSLYAFPGLVLAIAITAVLGPGAGNVAVAIGVIYIPIYYRVMRGQALEVREELYVEAAKAIGASEASILVRYVAINIVPSILAVVAFNMADAILTEAGLSFLGLGVGPDVPDWGWDLQKSFYRWFPKYWWTFVFPGLMVVICCIGLSLVGEGLSVILSPQIRK
ncbi:MAG: ABC transporter permease [Candidatus Heimdallarchaeota archaeon]